MTTLLYRRRAADCLEASRDTDDARARSELLRMALAWAELARWVESNQTTTPGKKDRDLTQVSDSVGVELRTQYADVLYGEIPDTMSELLKQLDRWTPCGLRS